MTGLFSESGSGRPGPGAARGGRRRPGQRPMRVTRAIQTRRWSADRSVGGRPIATIENIQRRLGEAELLLHQARLQLIHNAMLWDGHPDERPRLASSIGAAKVTATNNAILAVDQCMRVVGGAGMTKRLPLERYYRDVRGGLLHPINDDQLLVTLGQGVLREVETALEAADGS